MSRPPGWPPPAIWRSRVCSVAVAGLAPSAGRSGRGGDRPGRRRLHRALPRHRQPVGQADVGRLVGVGRAADLGAGPVLPLSRPHRAGARVRRPASAAIAPAPSWRWSAWSNLPIIKFSVDWWNTLHQPDTITLTGAPTMYIGMLWPLLFCRARLYAGVRRHRRRPPARRGDGAADPRAADGACGRDRRMTHLPFIVASYALGVLMPGTFAICGLGIARYAPAASDGWRPWTRGRSPMTRKRRRLWMLLACGVGPRLRHRAGADSRSRAVWYFSSRPREIATQAPPPGRTFRLGGLVRQGSVQRADRRRPSRGPVPRDGRQAPASRSPIPASFRTCSAKARASWRSARCSRTAPSAPPRCWRSTTRPTCRRKWCDALKKSGPLESVHGGPAAARRDLGHDAGWADEGRTTPPPAPPAGSGMIPNSAISRWRSPSRSPARRRCCRCSARMPATRA